MPAKVVYSDIINYLDMIDGQSLGSFNAKHGTWWYNSDGSTPITYAEFTTGNVPNVSYQGQPVPIMNTKDPVQSNFYLVLIRAGGIPASNNKQMPKDGPYITDPGWTGVNNNNVQLSGKQVMDAIEWWLSNGFPEK